MINISFDLLGNILLSLACFSVFLVLLSSVFKRIVNFNNNLISFNLFALFTSFIYLITQFLIDNFAFLYVASNSNIFLPTFYKFSASWSAHEGSFLLMTLILSLAMFINNLTNIGKPFINISNQIVAGIIFLYLLFVIFTSNPFLKIANPPPNGVDLNPLLQDPLLIIHPPVLFTGYVLYAITFSLVISGMFTKFDNKLFNVLKVWGGISWFTLTLGILLGSIWAYYELGWGGYWFWDPVENVALMPWLAGTAFSHSLIFSRNKILLSWMVFLGILTFLLSILGSFIVRSGVLNSVHTFAADPTRGIYLLSIFSLFSFISFVAFFAKTNNLSSKWPNLFSRTYLILLNNLIMMTILLIVFIGTLYPLFYESIYQQPLSVGPKYFSDLITPLVIALISIFSFEIFLGVRNKGLILVSLFLIVPLLFFIYGFVKNIGILFTGLILVVFILRGGYKIVFDKSNRETHKILGHFSVILLTFSVLCNHFYSKNVDLKLAPNERIQVFDRTVSFESIELENQDNFDSIKANFLVDYQGNESLIQSERRIYRIGGQITSETGISPSFLKDYLIVLGDRYSDGSWTLSFSIKYGIMTIWLSSVLLMLSMLYGIIKRSNE